MIDQMTYSRVTASCIQALAGALIPAWLIGALCFHTCAALAGIQDARAWDVSLLWALMVLTIWIIEGLRLSINIQITPPPVEPESLPTSPAFVTYRSRVVGYTSSMILSSVMMSLLAYVSGRVITPPQAWIWVSVFTLYGGPKLSIWFLHPCDTASDLGHLSSIKFATLLFGENFGEIATTIWADHSVEWAAALATGQHKRAYTIRLRAKLVIALNAVIYLAGLLFGLIKRLLP